MKISLQKHSTTNKICPESVGRKQAGYTLIELLVVIGIIAVLAGIIFPVFTKIRASARTTSCTSNVRQIGAAILMYATDADEQFPPYFDHIEGNRCAPNTIVHSGAQKYWPELIRSYISKGSGTTSPISGQARIEDLPSIFICPESIGETKQPANYQLGNVSSYGISDHIVNWWTPNLCTAYISHTLPEVVAPSQTVLLAETYDWFSKQHDLPGSALALSPLEQLRDGKQGAKATLDARHAASFHRTGMETPADPKGRNMVVFCDGHVKAISVEKLTTSAELWSLGNNGQWP